MTGVTTVAQWQHHASARLTAADAEAGADINARGDTHALLGDVLGKPQSWLIAHAEAELSSAQTQQLEFLLARRLRGEPLAYLIGRQEFWSLSVAVNSAVLIPRPETELLVERALVHAGAPKSPTGAILELGCGSGAVGIALAKELPERKLIASDVSDAALSVARDNARRLGVTLEWVAGDWFGAVGGRKFAVVVANPPYVAADDPHLRELGFEPRCALVPRVKHGAPADGLEDLTRIIAAAPRHLLRGGYLILEHGYQQGAAVRKLFAQHGFTRIATHRDLGQCERVSEGCWE